jgi:3-oxoacyl-[acyl-carrier protein] reductase
VNATISRPWAVVAGVTGGLGRAAALALAADGWNVVGCYRSNAARAAEVEVELQGLGAEVRTASVDLVDSDAVRALAGELAQSGVKVAGAVYAAGPMIPMNFIARTTPEVFGQQIDQDLKAAYNFVHPFLPAIREQRGSICAIVTPVITRYTRMDLLSSAPKAGVQALIRGLACEEGRFGVRANCVGVGVIKGDGLWTKLVESGDFTEKGLEHAMAAIPLGEFGEPEDVGDSIAFLMSPKAKWVTGQTLNVDGGYSV